MKYYNHFTEKDREELFVLRNQWITNKEIASILNKHPSSIWREIKRNKVMIWVRNNWHIKAKLNPENFHYIPDKANKKYLKRRKESKQLCPLKTIDLFKYIPDQIIGWLSPEIIAWRAKLEWIWTISHECIYQFIYSRMWMKMELAQHLPRSHKRRKKKTWRKWKRTLIPNRVWIELRPRSVEDRQEFWHWEWDSVLWVWKWAALNTNRERKSRKIFIEKIERKTAENTRIATINRFNFLPDKAKISNTFDNWSEFTQHEEISKKCDMKIYFADPYSSWQRWTNENWNWLIRRFFPKKTDFNKVTKKQLKEVEDWINNRPMKCLWFRTPNEVFDEEIRKITALPSEN